MRGLYVASVALHVLAAAVWIGGMVAFSLAALPVLRAEPGATRARLVEKMGLRLRAIGWLSLGLLAITGLVLLVQRTGSAAALVDGATWEGVFGRLLAAKLALFASIAALAAVHDFGFGPRAAAVARARPDSQLALRLRRRAGWLGRLNLLLSVAALVAGVLLVRGLP